MMQKPEHKKADWMDVKTWDRRSTEDEQVD